MFLYALFIVQGNHFAGEECPLKVIHSVGNYVYSVKTM